MSIAEKLITIAENEQRVYDAGYNSAVKEGTITITENTKELKIEGFPKAPKTFNLCAKQGSNPTTDDVYYVRGLDYIADGIMNAGSNKLLACLWITTSTNVYDSGFVVGSITESVSDKENLIAFENGTFTIKLRSNNYQYYGENFTYHWIATF